jgi:hypothetical protein
MGCTYIWRSNSGSEGIIDEGCNEGHDEGSIDVT